MATDGTLPEPASPDFIRRLHRELYRDALTEVTVWFLKVCIDQVSFMSSLFELNTLIERLRAYVDRSETLKPEAARITGIPERTARRLLKDVVETGLLESESPKGPVSLRFPTEALLVLFPRLYP